MSTYKKEVYSKIIVEGVHSWDTLPEALQKNNDLYEVSYLHNPHRHLFHIKCFCKVGHDDRDIEFILFGHKVKRMLLTRFESSSVPGSCSFGSMSCEMIGQIILDAFPEVYKVDVSEDDENGSIIERES